ncbi:polysaccharide pyruvyl transferase family protein [Enterovibrio norvegicus]|uniref:polysaccharide pyruvyl transferase family protein n=1 Tax=Enterovibrio norvegicus TaxID=188144 RepID=UPI0024B196FA|nr:polysaccharide pyruvyl transferase family protein [Enterovibrio norvegicus]
MTNKIKIGLLWHNLNSENFGVGALAIAHVSMIVDACKNLGIQPEFLSIGTPSIEGLQVQKNVEERLNVQIRQQNFSVKGMARSFFTNGHEYSCDVYFDLGEGDSFTDIYGKKRFFNLFVSKAYILFKRKELVLSPQTYGPFKSKVTQSLARVILKKVSRVFSRDYKSTSILKRMEVPVVEVADVAFSLPYTNMNTMDNTVGINVSGLLWNGGYTGNNQFGLKCGYKELVRDIITLFLDRGKKVHLVSHVISDNFKAEDDYRTSIEIKESYFSKNENVIVGPKFTDPMDAKSYISRMEFFLGSRMHATIAALSSGVAVLPLAYSRKFEGVFGSIGYKHCVNLHEDTYSEIVNKINDSYDNKASVRNDAIASKSNAMYSNGIYAKHLEAVLKNAIK